MGPNDSNTVGIWDPDLTLKTILILDHEQYNMVYEGNYADKMNWNTLLNLNFV